jgi:hypothetical protein
MQIEKQATVFTMGHVARERPMLPQTVADAWAFEDDDLRAQIDQQLSGTAGGYPLAACQHPKPGQQRTRLSHEC